MTEDQPIACNKLSDLGPRRVNCPRCGREYTQVLHFSPWPPGPCGVCLGLIPKEEA
jgi:hypothetical protein